MKTSDPISKLIVIMQRMQTSFRARSKDPRTFPEDVAAQKACADVLGDVIRLAAEIRAGDGERNRVP